MRTIYRNEDFIVVIKEVNIDSEKELPELINKELDMREKQILFNIFYRDIDSVVTLQIYE